MKDILALIDGDGAAFAIAAAFEKTILWEDDVISTYIDLKAAKDGFINYIGDVIAAAVQCSKNATVDDVAIHICFSDPSRRYFRHDIYPEYKGNRKGNKAPIGLKALTEWISGAYRCSWQDNLEGDDILGIMATSPDIHKDYVPIIVSIDKDMRQIPGWHMDAKTLEVDLVSDERGELLLATQALSGDTVDGYPGLPGCGPVGAHKILKESTDYLGDVIKAYQKKGYTKEDAIVQWNVARILQYADYDQAKLEPILEKGDLYE